MTTNSAVPAPLIEVHALLAPFVMRHEVVQV